MSSLEVSTSVGVQPHSIPTTTPFPTRFTSRPQVAGKFLCVNDQKLWVRGVTYGTFRPDERGNHYGAPDRVRSDFESIAAHGFNAVRTYTVPPRWLLDLALEHGLYAMVGLPWEQHIAFLDGETRSRNIERQVRQGVRGCAKHPAILCYAVGNEIPSSIVRWHGARRVGRFVTRLADAAHEEDPGALVTYVNFPSTEYLDPAGLDLLCFNVYLESQQRLDGYLARLQNLAGDRPLLMGEIGFDSHWAGEETQARVLEWQVQTAFGAGCAGAFLYAWTDEWYRGGYDIEDWDFGLTRRDRAPKAALARVRGALQELPIARPRHSWPSISVVVCSYNGSATIADCLDGLSRLDYPDYEILVIDDGSTDATAQIARSFGVGLISTPNRGLSQARNTGLRAARGEIVAYTDDDARPDPHWLTYLADMFLRTEHVGVGGPNIAPAGDGPIADCVAHAPGGPVHVLLSDQEAEHIPGCNMAFRREALEAIGGFDPRFRTAGDDVDICWRLQERGGTLGFHAGAMVWHHRRNSLRAYWRQQMGYGRAEALLEQKWPDKYNTCGHLAWAGRMYGKGLAEALGWSVGRIYHGVWGSAFFQRIYQKEPGTLAFLPLMPEWYLAVLLLAALSGLGALWAPLRLAWPLLAVAASLPVLQAIRAASRARFTTPTSTRAERARLVALTAALHLIQPAARLQGRLWHGLTPWRRASTARFEIPLARRLRVWSEKWFAPEDWLHRAESALRTAGRRVARGSAWDRWDLEVTGGLLGGARLRMAVEEHGAGRQLIRFKVWPRWSAMTLGTLVLLALLTTMAVAGQAWVPATVLGAGLMGLLAGALYESGRALGGILQAIPLTEQLA
jgi:GT2 family glycosyltransferase